MASVAAFSCWALIGAMIIIALRPVAARSAALSGAGRTVTVEARPDRDPTHELTIEALLRVRDDGYEGSWAA